MSRVAFAFPTDGFVFGGNPTEFDDMSDVIHTARSGRSTRSTRSTRLQALTLSPDVSGVDWDSLRGKTVWKPHSSFKFADPKCVSSPCRCP
jgi:hypothetical protein